MTKAYKPIDCGLYDRYELAAMHGSLLKLELDNGNTLEAVIVDLQNVEGVEFMRLNTGERVRLDAIKDFSILKEYSAR